MATAWPSLVRYVEITPNQPAVRQPGRHQSECPACVIEAIPATKIVAPMGSDYVAVLRRETRAMELLILTGICVTLSTGLFIKGTAEFPRERRSFNGQSRTEIAFRRTARLCLLAGFVAGVLAVASLIVAYISLVAFDRR